MPLRSWTLGLKILCRFTAIEKKNMDNVHYVLTEVMDFWSGLILSSLKHFSRSNIKPFFILAPTL